MLWPSSRRRLIQPDPHDRMAVADEGYGTNWRAEVDATRGELIVVADEGEMLGNAELRNLFSKQPSYQRLPPNGSVTGHGRVPVACERRQHALKYTLEVDVPRFVGVGEAFETSFLETGVAVDRLRPKTKQDSALAVE